MADQVKNHDATGDDKPTKVAMNPERVKQLKILQDQVRIGGKGTQRRKKKIVHVGGPAKDDKQLINTLKKLGANPIPGIEEVNLFRNDNMVITIKNPKVQTALACNTFSVSGTAVEKPVSEVVGPSFGHNMNPESLAQLRSLSGLLSRARAAGGGDGKVGGSAADDDVPVPQENFDQNA